MRWLLIAFAMAAAPVMAKPLTPQEQAQLEANMARGDLLYAYDQAAWHVTDAALKMLPKEAPVRLKGYIVTPDPSGYRTTFYGGDKGRYFRGYSGVWTGKDVKDAQLYPLDGTVPVTTEEARLIDARTVALASGSEDLFLCSKSPPNTAVIPGPGPNDPISVYVLSSSTEKGVLHLGGHSRIDVKDGKVVAQRKFTNGCVTFDSNEQHGDGTAAFVITHVLDPVPTEIHYFSRRYMSVPLAVGTQNEMLYWLDLKDGRVAARTIESKPR